MKKSIIIVLSVIIIIILGAIGLFIGMVTHDLKIEEKLSEEWSRLGYEDTIDMNIYSTGDYAKVERQIKENFKNLYEKSDELLSLFEQKEYLNLLTNQNYAQDGPNFEQSFILLEQINTKATSLINEIQSMNTEEFLQNEKNKIKSDDDYYKNYYVDVLKNRTIFFESINDIMNGYQEFSNTTSKISEILLFLKENKKYWNIKNDVFIYTSESFYQKYLSLFDSLNEDNETNNSTEQ